MSNSDTTSPNKSEIVKKPSNILFIALLAILVLLGVQSQWQPIKETPLAGASNLPSLPDQALDAWIEGEWQKAVNARANRDFAWRSSLIRLINQVRYSLWDDHTPHVLQGKDGYLFEAAYQRSVCGDDFVGRDSVDHMIRSLDRFRNALLGQGKRLVIVVAPNKWRTFKNKIDLPCEAGMTNYQSIVPALQARGYAVFDAIEVFQYEQLHQPSFPIHSKQGTHWSHFGAALSIDYLRYAFAQEGIKLPQVSFEKIDTADRPRNTDKDLHDLLNIMAHPEPETLAYPSLRFVGDHKPRVCIIGDSYYWTYFTLGAHFGLFDEQSKFFYYNKSLVGEPFENPNVREPLTDARRKEEIAAADAVLLIMSEPSLCDLGFGIQKLELL